MKSVIIIGGDERQIRLKNCLVSHGIQTELLNGKNNSQSISSYNYVVLPIPVSKDGVNIYSSDKDFSMTVNEVMEKLTKAQIVFGGSMNQEFKTKLKEKDIEYYDILEDENFIISNAHLTAQGCLRLLLENTGEYIPGSKALIIGFGKVASALSMSLKAMGLDVYIAARSENQLQSAKCLGYKTVKLSNIGSCVYYFDYIFGTVPSNVLTKETINLFRDDCVYFELASAPFTAKKDDFIKLNKKYVFGGSLPGRYLPSASGRLLCDYIMQFISRQKE